MSKKIIWGNMVVKNEDRYVYFAIESVIQHLDKLLIYDTGSTDKTVQILKFLKNKYPEKIHFSQFESVDHYGLTKLRQKMLDQTKSDWLLLVDGDEIWWEQSIKEIIDEINKADNNLYALVNPVLNIIGDIYHYQEEEAGRYEILGKRGHFNLRVINRKIKGLHIKNAYPNEGFYDLEENLIQQKDNKLKLLKKPILHFTHLIRSTINDEPKKTLHRKKFKYELGKKFSNTFKYPEVLYKDYPHFVLSPWKKSNTYYKLRAFIETPLRKIKRRFT